ncbi:MAG: hypothetical protein DRP42_06660, partial [Tenericutes bacterium]
VDNASPAYPVIRVTLGTTANTVSEGDHTHVDYAPIASPTFTGTPEAPTPADNSTPTALATTQYVADNSSSGITNLSYTPSTTDGTVTSDTGTDATVPLADGTNAGLMTAAEKTVVGNTTNTNSGDNAVNVNAVGNDDAEAGASSLINAVIISRANYALLTPTATSLYIFNG